MLGNLIERIRKEKCITKTDLSKVTGINIGHLTHIEKSTRNPSHKLLKTITTALNIPYESLYHTYDKELDDKQIEYNYINHIPYSKIPACSNIDLIDCPANFSNASFAFKAPDNSMNPVIKKNSYVFVEINGLVKNKDIGLFNINNEFVIRKLIYKKNNFILKANDKSFNDIHISDFDDFSIIGKIYV